ncbi:MAG: aminopeptidase [Nanoarchaeota archaeon]|nr:aminopeptidase [Nanoarchaeota archaeon]
MHSKEILDWLKKYRLLSIAKNHSAHFKNILKKSLNVRNDPIFIICDYGTPRHRIAPLMGGAYYFAAKKLGLDVKIVVQDVKNVGDSADQIIINTFKKISKPSVLVFNLSNKLGRLGSLGKSYRRYVKERKHRFTSALGMASINTHDFYYITRALNVNYVKLRRECVKLKKALDWGREVIVQTSAGTDLKINITGCKSIANDGKYDLPGCGGNMPCGEVYIPPKIDTAEGKIIIDCSSKNINGTRLVDKPITIKVKKGIVTGIGGGYVAQMLKKSIAWAGRRTKNPSMVRQIGELGIGMNPKANVVGAMVVDEKVLGTAHIALGNNYWFGGDVFTIIHLDQVFKNPKLFIDGKEYKLPKKNDFL